MEKLIKRKRNAKSRLANRAGLQSVLEKVEKSTLREKPLPVFKGGDTVAVHVRIKEGDKERIQIFEGVVLGRYNQRANRSFKVRKISHGYGVERTFLENSPKVAKIDVIQSSQIRRAKIYYVREREGKAAKIDRETTVAATLATGTDAASVKKSS